jgi:pseudouridine-5'-phosphate glycosidase
MRVHPEVAAALAAGRPVVALESTLVTHGLPRPDNFRIARELENSVREDGALPATVAVLGGEACIGLEDAALERLAGSDTVVKASVRDLAVLAAHHADGATTVAATAHLAARAGIAVFATGGLGGVHRDSQETFDESADLRVLARTPILLVCSGVKSILDVPATLERLETLSVGVLGYRTDTFPAFYLRDSGQRVPWRVESAAEIAATWRARQGMGTEGYGLVVANPVPLDAELDRELHDRTLAAGIAAARAADVHGKDVTPFLLAFFHRETSGQSVAANVALVRDNARLAAAVAVELASH